MFKLHHLVSSTAMIAIVTFSVDAHAACDDFSDGSSRAFCEAHGYWYKAETQRIDWDVAGPAKITQDYTPKVKKTDVLVVDACLAPPDVTATDTHAVTYTKSDSIAVALGSKIGASVQAKVNTLMVGELGITASVEFSAGRTTTSVISEAQTYSHTLSVKGCSAARSDWKVIGMHDAKVQVPMTAKDQFRYRCSGWFTGTNWSPWYTCATHTDLAKGSSGEGCLSKAVETNTEVTGVACAAVHPDCDKDPEPCPTTTTTANICSGGLCLFKAVKEIKEVCAEEVAAE